MPGSNSHNRTDQQAKRGKADLAAKRSRSRHEQHLSLKDPQTAGRSAVASTLLLLGQVLIDARCVSAARHAIAGSKYVSGKRVAR